jgi:hypothetical protein
MPTLVQLVARQKATAAPADEADTADTAAAAPSYSMSAEGIAITWGTLLGKYLHLSRMLLYTSIVVSTVRIATICQGVLVILIADGEQAA